MVSSRTMNAKFYLAVAALGWTVAGHAQERLELSQVPAPVREAVSATRDRGTVKEIVRRTEQGRTIYEVEFERNNAPNPRLRFAEDGTPVRDPASTETGSEGVWLIASEYPEGLGLPPSALKLEDLPAPVQETARREADGRKIADIDQESWEGKTVYEVEFSQRGRNSQVHIAEDGTLLRDERERSALKSRFFGLQIDDTPPAVQETIRRVAGDREIIDIDRRGTKERPVYRVVARRNGISYEILHVGMDGKVLFNNGSGSSRGRG